MSLNTPITDWQGRRVWVVGASSGIGSALVRTLAIRGARLALSARNEDKLRMVAAECRDALVLPLDVTDPAAFVPAMMQILDAWGGLDLAVFNAGTYVPLRAWDLNAEAVRHTLHTNLLGVMDGAAAVIPQFLLQGCGAIAIMGSVAGYRGLPQAITYGPSKAALINFAEALYLDLAPRGVSVFLISPGFVETPLTAGNKFEMPALITAEMAAHEIVRGLARGEFEIHFPRRFSWVMKLVRGLPDSLYFRLIRRVTRP